MRKYGMPGLYLLMGAFFLVMVVKGAPWYWHRNPAGQQTDPGVISVVLVVGALFLFWLALSELFGDKFLARLWTRISETKIHKSIARTLPRRK
jgi:hypothetical protein